MRLVALLCLMLAAPLMAAPEAALLEPRLQLVTGSGSVTVRYVVLKAFKPSSVRVPNTTVERWQFTTEEGVKYLELTLKLGAGQDLEWHTLEIVDAKSKRSLEVGGSRIVWADAATPHPISFERIEQQFGSQLGQRPYWGVRIFNDSNQKVTLERLIYAPRSVMSGRIALQTRYDPEWFSRLGAWAANPDQALPGNSSIVDANAIKLEVLPSRGFSLAILGLSFKPLMACKKPLARASQPYLQPVLQYRVGGGQARLYPLPDTITALLCP
jgi:hypothetical protein